MRMTEPHASEFQRLVRSGAGTRDIHAAIGVGFARRAPAPGRFVQREMDRVDLHRKASCALLEAFVGRAPRLLDVGCSTGGSTVALALSDVLAPERTIGVDPDALSLRAAEVRARGHGLDPRRISFVRNEPDRPLPFTSHAFDLVVCLSVLEFVPEADARRRLVEEM